ncbi:hypothetical protein [Actinoplanes subglobosus]|uniref:Uncharacterized protein n=1 Tax=Actinoplanes subglobosus TaxID=1547892 RepID=A0ABV8IWA4_9ACTN
MGRQRRGEEDLGSGSGPFNDIAGQQAAAEQQDDESGDSQARMGDTPRGRTPRIPVGNLGAARRRDHTDQDHPLPWWNRPPGRTGLILADEFVRPGRLVPTDGTTRHGRLTAIRATKIRATTIRATKIRVTAIRVTKIRATAIPTAKIRAELPVIIGRLVGLGAAVGGRCRTSDVTPTGDRCLAGRGLAAGAGITGGCRCSVRPRIPVSGGCAGDLVIRTRFGSWRRFPATPVDHPPRDLDGRRFGRNPSGHAA